MSNPWPERRSTPWGFGKTYEDDAEYTVFLLQQLFVELAELRTLVAKQMTPIYHLNAPEIMDAVKRERQEDMGFP